MGTSNPMLAMSQVAATEHFYRRTRFCAKVAWWFAQLHARVRLTSGIVHRTGKQFNCMHPDHAADQETADSPTLADLVQLHACGPEMYSMTPEMTEVSKPNRNPPAAPTKQTRIRYRLIVARPVCALSYVLEFKLLMSKPSSHLWAGNQGFTTAAT